jgi:hypothetical protein|tara:strand:+ start:426 stop:596 length:171 start_codon:yes stop_codon:yes gene_type:complete
MLELVGFIALVYVAIKFLPGILVFAGKVMIVLIGLWLLLGFVAWLAGDPIAVMLYL